MNKKRCVVIKVVALAAVLMLASSCTTSTNNQPIITSLEAEAGRTTPSGSLQVVCTASDPDGDELSYIWWASGGEIDGGGVTVTWTAPASEGSHNVTVKVIDGNGGEVTDYISITVRANEPPTITGLVAGANWTAPSGSVQVTCTASDADGDELSYDWITTGGDISGTGAVAIWTAPEEVGTYDITVVVKDDHGSSATSFLTISVLTEQPPIIEDLIITAEHCYLKEYSGGYYVGKGQMYDIECIVADTDIELFYEWSCTDGELPGEGSLVTWTAPNTSGYVTVTVTVSDIAGSRASKDMILTVVNCSPCTFGC
ncbi:MAG: hypothetical protein WBH01_07075 [Dehalococcoidia bacterium]